jgi:putative phage-type endonuclease
MFISDEEKRCLKQKNYKDLEIAVADFLKVNEIGNETLHDDDECNELSSVIEVIFKDAYCDGEDDSDLQNLIFIMLKTQIKETSPEYDESTLNYLDLQLTALEKTPQPEQRTTEWYEFRNNRLTASDLWHITNWNDAKVHDILKKKCGVEQKFGLSPALLHGIKFEEVATKIYEKRNNVQMVEFGCLPHPFIPYFGASPDGICGINSSNKNLVGRMLEIKCPKSRIITGFIPEGYRAQIQGQLEVCGLEYCDYLECEIRVYNSKKDYLDDCFVNEDGTLDINKTRIGNEKGIIFETFNTDIKNYSYEYKYDNFLSIEEIDKWEEPFIDTIIDSTNLEHGGTTFWYLNKLSVVLVKRDRDWFNSNFCKIKKFWDFVEHSRINGIPERKKRGEKKIDMAQFTGSEAAKAANIVLKFGE